MSKRSIPLKGAAAGAFVRAMKGEIKDELDEYRQLATLIHLEVQCDKLDVAAEKLRAFVASKRKP